MEEPWLHIHPDFKLNGKNYSISKLINVAEAMQFEGDQEEKIMADFLLNWLYPKDTILANTSGSTGSPKTITLSKTKMIASAKATGKHFNLPEGTKALHCLSANYIAGKMMMVRALYLGWHIDVVTPNKYPLKQTNQIYDFAAMVPLQLQNSLNEIHRVKKLIVGGAAVSPSLQEQIQELPTEVYATYAMTETITHVAIKKLNHRSDQEMLEDAYEALPNVHFSIDDRECLIINAPDVAERKVITNDVVNLISPTQFNWLGRADFVINSGGFKVHPEQVEQVLALVIDAPIFVSSLPDALLGQKVILVVEGKEAAFPEIDYVGLHPYEVPKEVYFVDEMVYTTTGKIQRDKTKERIFS
jgi:O-succinylbenzoic acid--CoA ligase